MTLLTTLNLLSAFFMFVGAVPPFYFGIRIGNRVLRTLSVLLSLFMIFHGLYHIAFTSNIDLVSDIGEQFFEPLSWLMLLSFAVYYSKRLG